MNEKQIVNEYNVNPIVAQLLIKRNFNERWKIEQFISPSLEDLYDSSLIPDIQKIKEVIETHIEFGDKIFVFGDYDVDGVTSSVIMYNTLRGMGADVEVIISNRFKGGYSFSEEEIDMMDDAGLIISLDCGINSHDEIEYAKSKGINFIVIDHHESDNPPDCLFADLKVKQGDYPFYSLSGAGITWKVCQYLLKNDLYQMLDLVSLSTIADMVPLLNENRIIAKYGLKKIDHTNNIGLQQLMSVNGVSDASVGTIGFKIAPCINAQGRLYDNQLSFDLLTITNKSKTRNIAQTLYEVNEERKLLSEQALIKAENQVDEDDNFIIVQGDYPPGIVGLIASDIKDKLNKPTLVFGTEKDGVCKGSGRSVTPLHILDTLKQYDDLFQGLGGHKKACGCLINKTNLPLLKEKINNLTSNIEYADVKPDLEINADIINKKLINDLEIFQPCGIGNPTPKFLIDGDITNIGTTSNGKHLTFKLNNIDCIAFNQSDIYSFTKVIGTPEVSYWGGREKIQIKVRKVI